jgi:transcription elongation factor Elf1
MEADLSGFTGATVIVAEGARVAIVSCETCGAALLLDPRETISVIDRHRAWHEARVASDDQEGRP